MSSSRDRWIGRRVAITGLGTLIVGFACRPAFSDVVSLEYLLSGHSLKDGTLTYENFRNFSGGNENGYRAHAVDPNSVMVSYSNGGVLEFGSGGFLVGTVGQVPYGGQFTFDVRSTAITQARLQMSGYVSEDTKGQAVQLSTSLTSSIANPPFQLVVNNQAQNVAGPFAGSTFTAFQPTSELTVTLQFVASGLTSHGDNSYTNMKEIDLSFVSVPEPGAPTLVVVFALAGLAYRWCRVSVHKL